MDKRLKKMEERLSGTEPTDEEKRKMRQAEKEVDAICDRIDPFMRTQQKKEKKELKAAAKKSLDPGHWTKEIMNAEAKFSSKVEENLEDKLSKESIGLMTYEALKAKKEALEASLEETRHAQEEQKRKAEDDARKDRELKKIKGKSKLSFNPDED